MIVDDGSDDGTRELAAELAASTPWIRVVERAGAGEGQLEHGRREGRDLSSFRAGVVSLERRHDVVVKVDADLSFDDDLLRRARLLLLVELATRDRQRRLL